MLNTINPADCDRVTVYAGECRNFQDTEWITFNSGRRRSPDARDGNTWLIDVAHGSFWMRDDQVRDLVRLVPARPITRNDLPGVHWPGIHGDGERAGAEMMLDAVVEHLNANGGVPPSPDSTYGIPCEDYAYVDWPATCAAEKAAADRAEADRDRWRRAHEIVEGERDQARRERDEWEEKYLDTDEALHQARTERDEAEQRYRDTAKALAEWHGRWVEVERDRDEWKARAEAAEAACEGFKEYIARFCKPNSNPAVTREDVEKAVHGSGGGFFDARLDAITDAVWSLVSGDDPAVLVVRESDVAAVEVQPINGGKGWLADGSLVNMCESPTESEAQEAVDHAFALLVGALAAARAIEAGQAADPVEDKAREFAALIDWELTDREAELLHTVAKHVIGQEANDERP